MMTLLHTCRYCGASHVHVNMAGTVLAELDGDGRLHITCDGCSCEGSAQTRKVVKDAAVPLLHVDSGGQQR